MCKYVYLSNMINDKNTNGMELTKTQIRKTQIALNETESALINAKNYSEDLQDYELIIFLNKHILKLRKMLRIRATVNFWTE